MAPQDRLLILSLMILYTQGVVGNQGTPNSADQRCDDLPSGIIGWSGYISEWKHQYPLMSQLMFPYGPTYCDVEERDDRSVKINAKILFYAVQYDAIIITIHGHVSFFTPDRENPPINGEWHKPYPWPNRLFGDPREKDPAMAAIFYTTHATQRKGVLHYRTMRKTGKGDAVSRVQDGMLEHLSEHVQQAVIGAAEFTATYGLVVTWEGMTFAGVNCLADDINDNCPRNTYQMALVTDNQDTYVIYNYYNVSWAGTTAMGCDPKTGRPSDAGSECVGAQIGFNVGDGRFFWSHPYSLSTKVVDLDRENLKGSTVRGRFFYKVSDAFIQRGGCTNDHSIAGRKWPLTIGPTSGGMFGGYDMNISAPCFEGEERSGDRIQCKFGESVITEGYYEQNPMMARCPVPMMSSVGRINVGVSNDGGSNFRYSTHLTVGMQGYVPAGITVVNPSNDWLNVEKFDIQWDPRGISWRKVDFVDINLYGYKETTTTGDTQWLLLHTLAANVKNDGYYTIHPSQHKCGGMDAESHCVEYTVGLLGVEISGTNPGASPTALWSDPLPVGWFVKDEAPKHIGRDWAHEMCRLWHSEDIKVENWDQDLQVCPCTLSQAYHDWGRFAEDMDCNNRKDSNTQNCKRHKGASQCVRSTVPTSTGAGAHCCYDKNGDIMYSGDTQYGSTPDKAHAWGALPYGASGRVPLLSHWFWDVAPFYACCEWQDDDHDCFYYYIKRRTSPSCQTYQPPGHAAAFGDPHIRTFDDVTYTYNGKGEFILLKVDSGKVGDRYIDFVLQARYEQPKPQGWGTPKGTVITAVGMRTSIAGGKDGDILEIQRNNYKPGDRRLLVYVNRKLIDFRDSRMWRQDFDDMVIFNNDPGGSKFHTNFTIIFRGSLIGVQVAYKQGLMHVITVVPPDLKYKTTGLFGIWDDVPDNDIQHRDGGSPVRPDETERIHDHVGHSWQISGAESLFSYWAKVNRDYYEDKNFRPVFIPTFPQNNTGVTEAQVRALCGDNIHCQYDYMITLDKTLAEDTLKVQAWMQQQSDESKTVVTCGWLEIPYAVKSGGKPYPGGAVTIQGCRDGFTLEGPTLYRCVAEGDTARWKPDVTTRCKDQSEEKAAEVQMAIAIGVPAGIIFILIVIGIMGLLCYLRQKRIDRGPKGPLTEDLEHIPASTFHASDIRKEDIITNDKPTKKKKPRPAKRNDPMSSSRSHDDLSSYGSQGNAYPVPNKIMSASADALDRDISFSTKGSSIRDEPDLDLSLQSDGSRGPRVVRPYNYPRNTETIGERRRAPYAYPRNTESNLTPEERALIEQRTHAFNQET